MYADIRYEDIRELAKIASENNVEITLTADKEGLSVDIKESRPMSAEREWVPVSERLPEQQEKSYWICTDCGYQCECRWTNVNHFWTELTTDWHWHFMDVPQYQKVVAWMDLPEPYRESEGKE